MAAKPSKMLEEAKKQSEEELQAQLAARNYVAPEGAWDAQEGEEYGGKSDILLIQVGEVVGPFEYVSHQQMTTDLGDTTVHIGTDKDGNTLRLPIQATFQRAIDQAGIQRGDTFLVRREEDQIKKRGAGKDKPMAIYAVKVTKRAPRAAAPAA